MSHFSLSPDNPVRRRLFNLDPLEQATIDNFANILQEEAARSKTEKMQKWNFDFENEIPLEGQFEWIRCEEPINFNDRFNETRTDDMEVADNLSTLGDPEEDLYEEEAKLIIKKRNETTPGKQKDIEVEPLMTTKRMEKTTNLFDKAVRRNISFE